ncbi:hypothetical protein P170DRAFT_351982 [Aspergillus steynii IBT 23096]|uniref:Altered inheritance of mitochondria protein 11 n=1 Tax=Aspergillus steynii IBT 23096 TaxID=1392250 RepID=A0A2I2GI79_9EURO|nr:uncharacterized protein P170DRAFT_351982 [Aspergillus steynii IBT 23096]PLB52579.1 hypothetical protein P170DRAFT_351982 [Aspergillus steynii IBT 23096]
MLSSLFSRGSDQPSSPPASTSNPQDTPSSSTTQNHTSTTTAETKPENEPLPELRFIKPTTKHKLLLGGLAFMTFSLMTTRRALKRRWLAQIPPYYTSAPYHRPKVNGGVEAFEALNLATLNVISFGMVGTGAAMVALDINRVEDMRRFVRREFNADGEEVTKTDQELEEEVAAWVGSVLGKKFEREVRKEQLEGKDGAGAAAVKEEKN